MLDITFHVEDVRWKAKLRPYCKTVQHILDVAVAEVKLKGKHEIAVVLADDAFVRGLNHQYRGKNKPTNVLSFPGDDLYLGDIVMALETVEREAAEQGKTFRDHAAHLLVHGFLHVLGYDHEEDGQAEKMEKKEIKILKKLGVTNPYL